MDALNSRLTGICRSSSERKAPARIAQCMPPLLQFNFNGGKRFREWKYSSRPLVVAASNDIVSDFDIGPAELSSDAEQYISLRTEDCEFLIAEYPDGSLNLKSMLVEDPKTGIIDRLDTASLPAGPQRYHFMPFYSEFLGNDMQYKLPKRYIWKYYMIPLKPTAESDIYVNADGEREANVGFDFTKHIFLLDGAERSVTEVKVDWLVSKDTEESELRLRIRQNGVVSVDSASGLPDVESTVRAHMDGRQAFSQTEDARLASTPVEAEVLPPTKEIEVSDEESDDKSRGAEEVYDEDALRDFLVEFDDETDEDFESEFDGESEG